MYCLALDVHYINLYSQRTSLSHQLSCIVSSFWLCHVFVVVVFLFLFLIFCFTLCTSCAPTSGVIEMKLGLCVCVFALICRLTHWKRERFKKGDFFLNVSFKSYGVIC